MREKHVEEASEKRFLKDKEKIVFFSYIRHGYVQMWYSELLSHHHPEKETQRSRA